MKTDAEYEAAVNGVDVVLRSEQPSFRYAGLIARSSYGGRVEVSRELLETLNDLAKRGIRYMKRGRRKT